MNLFYDLYFLFRILPRYDNNNIEDTKELLDNYIIVISDLAKKNPFSFHAWLLRKIRNKISIKLKTPTAMQ